MRIRWAPTRSGASAGSEACGAGITLAQWATWIGPARPACAGGSGAKPVVAAATGAEGIDAIQEARAVEARSKAASPPVKLTASRSRFSRKSRIDSIRPISASA